MADAVTYRYVATDSKARRREGKMRAPSAEAVASILESDGLIPGPISAVGNNPIARAKDIWADANAGGPKVKTLDLAMATKQFGVLMKAGLDVRAAIEASVDACPSKKLAGVLREVAQRLGQGEDVASAMSHYPRTFSESYLAYVASAEKSGTLPETFDEYLYPQLEQKALIESEVKSATAYPRWAGGIAGLMALGMIQFLLPKFQGIYVGFGGDLPAPTKLLITVKEQMHLIALGIVMVVVAWKVFLDQTRENLAIGVTLDRIRFRVPVFGGLAKEQAIYRYVSTLSALNRSAVNIDVALNIAGRASGSRWMMLTTPRVIDQIQDGESLANALKELPTLPTMVLALVATGEKAGELSETLNAASAALAQQISARIKTLGKKIESVTMFFVMMVMGAVIAGLWLPILQLSVQASENF